MKKIIGIYNAYGGFWGEVSYILRKISGSTSCALCDITHGYQIQGKKEWKTLASELDIPIETLHINEMDEKTKLLVGQNTPIVLLSENNKLSILMTKEELEKCQKTPSKFFELLKSKLS